MRLASKPAGIIYISDDHVRFKNRFSDVSEGIPDNRVCILPLSHAKQIKCLPIRNLRAKMTHILRAPGIFAKFYKLPGTTCEAAVSYTLNETGRQNASLSIVLFRAPTLKGLFLCEKLTTDQFQVSHIRNSFIIFKYSLPFRVYFI